MGAELRGIPPVKNRKFERILLEREASFTMGRFAGASLPILDVKVSRKPAVFEFLAGNWTLTDKASMNGVFVNDAPIPSGEAIVLRHGDVIKLGPLQDYRWIFFLEEEERPAKRSKVETQMLESMDRIDRERLSLVEELERSEESTRALLSRKDHLHKSCKDIREELTLREESQRADICTKVQDVEERERALGQLQRRLLAEKEAVEERSTEALRAVDDEISSKKRLLEENRRTISALQSEKREAQETLEREKKTFEERIATLKAEYEGKVTNEESYNSEYKSLSEEMERKLKAGCEKIEGVIEKEKREKEALQVEFEKMKVQSSMAQQRLEDVMGTCEEEFKCTICDEIFIKPVTTNCGHVFCEYCISKWKDKCKEGSFTCPNCRLQISSFSKNHYLENLIDSLVRKFGEDIQSQRDKMSSERDANDGDQTKEEVKKVHPLILAAAAHRANRKKKRKRS